MGDSEESYRFGWRYRGFGSTSEQNSMAFLASIDLAYGISTLSSGVRYTPSITHHLGKETCHPPLRVSGVRLALLLGQRSFVCTHVLDGFLALAVHEDRASDDSGNDSSECGEDEHIGSLRVSSLRAPLPHQQGALDPV